MDGGEVVLLEYDLIIASYPFLSNVSLPVCVQAEDVAFFIKSVYATSRAGDIAAKKTPARQKPLLVAFIYIADFFCLLFIWLLQSK